jgi:replicative DNA helicase
LFDKLVDVNVSVNKAQTVGVKLGEMSRIAEEFDCHICCLVQINRQVENRADKRPKMSDLKDSGNYEEAARLVMLLYREKYYFPDSMNDELEVIIAKQSNGPIGTAIMHFEEPTLKVVAGEAGFLDSM